MRLFCLPPACAAAHLFAFSLWLGGLASVADAAETPDAATPLETQTVEASPLGHTTDDLIQPAEVLSGAALNRKRRATIGETLELEPGVSTTDFGSGAARPVIRGQAGPRVQVLENGLPTSDVSDVSPDHAVTIDAAGARQVEVLKGPATLIYGSGATGGVVNVINGRLPTAVTEGLHGRMEGLYGSNADELAQSVELEYGQGAHQLHVDAGARRTGDSRIPGNADVDGVSGSQGILANSATHTRNAALAYAQVRDWGSVAGAVSTFNSRYGLPNEAQAFIDLAQTRYDLQGLFNRPWQGWESVKLRASYTLYDHSEFEDPATRGTVFENRQFQQRAEAVHAPWAGWRGVLGLQYGHRDFSALGAEAFLPAVKSQGVGVFWVEERPFSWGRVELGARIEHDLNDPEALRGRANPSRRFTPLSVSAGSVYNLGETAHLKLGVTHSERGATPEELYAFGPHAATTTFERGNSGQRKEQADNIELGFDVHRDRWRAQINAYYQWARDYLFQSSVDQGLNADGTDPGGAAPDGTPDRVDEDGLFDPAGEFLLTDYRQASARLYGVEGEVAYAVLQGPLTLDVRAFGDAVFGELTGGDVLPRITPARFGLEAEAGHGPWSVHLDWTRVQPQTRIANLETTTRGYHLLALDLAYRLPLQAGPTGYSELYLRGRNLLDEDIRRHTSFVKDRVPLPGASLVLGARWVF